MNRKTQSHTATAKVAAMKAATVELVPPQHLVLKEAARPFLQSILAGKAPIEWSTSDIEQAFILARCRSDIFRLQVEIEAEGDIVIDKINPKHVLVETLIRRDIALTRQLQIHARAIVGERRDQEPRRGLAKNTRAALDDWDDGLLARP